MRLVIRERRLRVGEEAQASLLVRLEPQREVVTDTSLFSSAFSAPELGHLFVKGDGPPEAAVPGPRDAGHE